MEGNLVENAVEVTAHVISIACSFKSSIHFSALSSRYRSKFLSFFSSSHLTVVLRKFFIHDLESSPSLPSPWKVGHVTAVVVMVTIVVGSDNWCSGGIDGLRLLMRDARVHDWVVVVGLGGSMIAGSGGNCEKVSFISVMRHRYSALLVLPWSSSSLPSSNYSYDIFRSLNSTPISTVSLETYYALQEEYLQLKEQHHKVQNDLTILRIRSNLEQDRVKMQMKGRYLSVQDICNLNRDASPLYGSVLTQTLSTFFSPNGISKEELWSAIDICNCDCVFGKGYLYTFHCPACLDWPKSATHGSSPSPPSTSSILSVSSTSVVQGLLTPIDDISMTEIERKRDDEAAGNFPKGREFDIEHLWSHVIGKTPSGS
ncbi:hypothetical protein M422DRAFT_269436 [Sphaerobolus stellatus SS14]|uniref:Uncharacterized protein n=1 Tax=Sphaerobolus stellatus (strain SS14) TaxID=990650 RepID=A0A0C9UVF0_SPHS4|nr:hypothetical protein M422DRAFT_269436 [Sphaerobolus stellatus SS14]